MRADEAANPLCACGCGQPPAPGRKYHSDACANRAYVRAHRERTKSATPLDLLLAESAAMGIVEKVRGQWRLTRQAELEYGRALRGLPETVRDDIAGELVSEAA